MITVDDFRSEALAFLEANAMRKVEERLEWGRGSDRIALLENKTPEKAVY